MNRIPAEPRRRRRAARRVALLLMSAAVLAVFGCGDEDSSSAGDPAAAEPAPTGSMAHAEELAGCAEEAGFDPTISDGAEPGATAVDLTTETATIVLQVFETPADAAGYESSAGLDQEQIGSVVILGGAIPPAQRDAIRACVR